MRLDQHIQDQIRKTNELQHIQDQIRKTNELRHIQDQIRKTNELQHIQDQIRKTNELRHIQDQIRKTNELQHIQDQIRKTNELRHIQDQIRKTNELQHIQDQIRKTNELRHIQDQIRKTNELQHIQDQIRKTNELRHIQDRITTAAPFMETIRNYRTIMDRVAAQYTAATDQIRSAFHQDMQDRITTAASLRESLRNHRTIIDGIATQYTAAIDQMRETNAFHQNMQDHISRLISFSHNLYPFVEKYAENLIEELPKEKAISKEKMADEVKRQAEDLFEELEHEEIADEVEFLERSWRKVVEVSNKIPDWLKNCLVMIIWSIYSDVWFQISHQAAGPTTIVHKPVTVIIKKATRQGLQLPSEYRFVIAKVLNVRERPKRHSDIRGKLFAGDLVMIKKKKKNWSLVEYSNEESGIKIQGWVFTRYLRKVNQ